MPEEQFVKQLQQYYANKGFLTKTEVGAGYGVADLVLVRLNPNKCKIRINHKQEVPLLKEEYFKTLKYISDIDHNKPPTDIDYLIKHTKLPRHLLKSKVLKELELNGYIKEINKNTYLKINGWVPIAKEVIAIEAKMHAWKRGLIQANRYKSFADKVYLAVPTNVANLVSKEMLIKFNIGLLSFDADKDNMKVGFKPSVQKPIYEDKRNFVSEFFWSYNGI